MYTYTQNICMRYMQIQTEIDRDRQTPTDRPSDRPTDRQTDMCVDLILFTPWHGAAGEAVSSPRL